MEENLKNRLEDRLGEERSRLVKGVGILMGGTVGGQLLAVGISPILTRMFSREEFGVLAAFALLLTFLSPIVGGRYDLAIPVAKDEKESTEAMAAALLSTIFVCLVVGAGMVFLGPWIAGMIGHPEASSYLFMIPLSLFAVGGYQALNYWAIREKEYSLTARTKLVQGLMLAVGQLAAGAFRGGALGLILADFVGRSSGKVTIGYQVWSRHKTVIRQLTWPGILETAKRFRAYPLYAAPAALLHAAASALPGLILGGMYGSAVLGMFFIGYRYVWNPVSVLGQSLAQVFNGEGAVLAKTDPKRLERGYWKIVKRLSLLGFVPFGVIGMFGEPIFGFIFGADYIVGGRFAQILSLGWYVQFVVGPVLPVLNLLEKQKWVLLADLVGLLLIGSSFFYANASTLSAEKVLGLYTISVTIMYGLLLWLGGKALRKLVQSSN